MLLQRRKHENKNKIKLKFNRKRKFLQPISYFKVFHFASCVSVEVNLNFVKDLHGLDGKTSGSEKKGEVVKIIIIIKNYTFVVLNLYCG